MSRINHTPCDLISLRPISIMDFELCPTITLRSRSINVLLAPQETFIQALNRNLHLQQFKVLYVSGNHSSILGKLDRRFEVMEVRLSTALFQLMTILEGVRHSVIIIEHDPMLYENAAEMVEYICRALSEASKEAIVLLYAPGSDPFLEDLSENADRVFRFDEIPIASPRLSAKACLKMKDQKTLESFS